MKIEWLTANITTVGSYAGAERVDMLAYFDIFLKFGPLLWLGSHFVIWRDFLLSPKKLS